MREKFCCFLKLALASARFVLELLFIIPERAPDESSRYSIDIAAFLVLGFSEFLNYFGVFTGRRFMLTIGIFILVLEPKEL